MVRQFSTQYYEYVNVDFAEVTPRNVSSESELSLFSRSIAGIHTKNDTSKSSSSGPSVQGGHRRRQVFPTVSSRTSTSNFRFAYPQSTCNS